MSASDFQPVSNSDPTCAKETPTTVPWYIEDITCHLTPEFRSVLEDYSHIPPDSVIQHVHDVRAKLWSRRAYPCAGIGMFQVPWIMKLPNYSSIVSLLKSGGTLIDMGCYIGHDLRQLVFSGAPSSGLVGVDLVDFWDLGFEMFRDEGRFDARYVGGDILDAETMRELWGTADVVYVSRVLHQFDLERATTAAENLVKLTKGKGSMIVGCQIGFSAAQKDQAVKNTGQLQPFGHDVKTWQDMWAKIGETTGTQWDVEVRLCSWEDYSVVPETAAFRGEDAGVLEFVVIRTG